MDQITPWAVLAATLWLLALWADKKKRQLSWRNAWSHAIGAVVVAAGLYVATDGGRELRPATAPICDEYGHCATSFP